MRRNIGQMVVIGLIASVIGIAVALSIHWFPTAASTQAGPIDTLFDVLIIVSVPVFVLVEVVVLFSVWKFRMRPGQELQDGPPIHGNTKLEIVWTAIPAIMLVSLCTYAYVVLTDVEKAQASEMHIGVTGQQFAWAFSYAPPGGKTVAADQLYVPVNKPILFQVRSKDVIHSFWVPAFRMKTDAVPGITTEIRVTPTRLGTYPVVCAELCGLGHGAMRSTVHVVTQPEFQAWLSDKTGGAKAALAPGPTGGPGAAGGTGPPGSPAQAAAAGKQVFVGQGGCGACHKLADAGTSGQIGPDLNAGLKGKDPAFIKNSILEPDAEVTKGYPAGVMPKTFGQQLSPTQVDELVKYLAQATK